MKKLLIITQLILPFTIGATKKPMGMSAREYCKKLLEKHNEQEQTSRSNEMLADQVYQWSKMSSSDDALYKESSEATDFIPDYYQHGQMCTLV